VLNLQFRFIMRGFLLILYLLLPLGIWAQLGYTEKGMATYYSDMFHGRRTANGDVYNKNGLTCAHKTLPFNSMVKVTNSKSGKSVVVKVTDRGPFRAGYIVDMSREAARQLDMLGSGVISVKIEVVGINGVVASKEKDEPKENNTNTSTPKEEPKVPQKESPGIPDKENPKEDSKINISNETLKKIENSTWIKQEGYYSLEGKKEIVKNYGIQIGAFENLAKAVEWYEKVRAEGYKKVYLKIEKKPKLLYKVVMGQYENEAIARKNIAEVKAKGLDGFVVKHQ